MNKPFTFLFLLFFPVFIRAQEDTSLQSRLNSFMRASEALDIDKVLDYTYPGLFTILPREQLKQAMEEAFNNKEVSIRMDSLRVDSLYPVFTIDGNRYAKITYSMNLLMKFPQEKPADSLADKQNESNAMMLTMMKAQYGKDKVTLNEQTGELTIKTGAAMVGVIDKISPVWNFFNIEEAGEFMDQLLPKQVQEKLATYQ